MSEPAIQTQVEVTWEDFVALPDDDRRELVDGELVELEVPTDLHEHAVAVLCHFLLTWGMERKALVLASGYKVRITARRAFMPDVQMYLAGNPARGQRQGAEQGHPDLAIEVISQGSGRYDRLLKMEGYARIGAPEYWLVDPALRTLERFVLRDGLYSFGGGASGDEVFRPATFEGLEIPLDKLWLDELA